MQGYRSTIEARSCLVAAQGVPRRCSSEKDLEKSRTEWRYYPGIRRAQSGECAISLLLRRLLQKLFCRVAQVVRESLRRCVHAGQILPWNAVTDKPNESLMHLIKYDLRKLGCERSIDELINNRLIVNRGEPLLSVESRNPGRPSLIIAAHLCLA